MKFIIILLLISSFSYARWATKDDVSEANESSLHVKVNADGTSIQTITMKIDILKEEAKTKYTLYSIPFRSTSSSLKVVEAKVINGTESLTVAPDKMVEKSPAKEEGIDDTKTIQIAFPNVKIGSKIQLKYVIETKQVPVPGHFSMLLTFLGKTFNYSDVIEVESPQPLFTKLVDPYKVFELSEKKEGNKHIYKVRSKEPYIYYLVDETSALTYEKIPSFSVSSDEDWQKISTYLHREYESVLNKPLPPLLEKVTEKVAVLKTDAEKVNALVAWITANFNYMGDWRTVSGQFIPRKFEQIIASKQGDCKDFSAILTAMLRKVGVLAHMAIVHRSTIVESRMYSSQIPAVSLFNHAIVRIVTREGTFWIDPTNMSSSSLNHRPDIAGKFVLPIDGKPILENIPITKYEENRLTVVKTFALETSGVAKVEGKVHLKGSAAAMFTGMENYIPKEKIQELVLGVVSQGEKAVLPEFSAFDLKSRLFKDILFDFKYTGSDFIKKKTGEKEEYLFLPPLQPIFVRVTQLTTNWEGDKYLGEPQQIIRQYKMKNVFVSQRLENCNLKSNWLDFQRVFTHGADGLTITDVMNTKESFISRSEFASGNYKHLEHNLAACAMKTAHVKINTNAKSHASGPEELDKGIANLPLAERVNKRVRMVEETEFSFENKLSRSEKEYLLRKNLAEAPKDPESWLLLAKTVWEDGWTHSDVMSRSNHLEALKIIEQALKVNNSDVGIWYKYVRYLHVLGEKEKALALFPKVLQMGKPTRLNSYIELASIYHQLDQTAEVLSTLRTAKPILKDDYDKYRFYFRAAWMTDKNPNHCVTNYLEAEKYWKKGMNNWIYTNVPSCLIKRGQFDEAVKFARKGKEIAENMAVRTLASSLRARGEDYIEKGKLDLARKDIEESLTNDQSSAGFLVLGKLEVKEKNIKRAIEVLTQGMKFVDGSLAGYLDEAGKLFKNIDWETSLKFHTMGMSASKTEATRLSAYRGICRALHKLNRVEDLKKNLGEALRIGEKIVVTHKEDKAFVLGALGLLYRISGEAFNNKEHLSLAIQYFEKLQSDADYLQYSQKQIFLTKELLEGRKPSSTED